MQRQARVWKRILAFIVDLYLCFMIFSAFLVIIEKEAPSSIAAAMQASVSPAMLAAIIYASIFILLYHVFCEYIIGQTPGMMLFQIAVDNTRDKKGLRFWQALGRNLFIIPVFPLTLLWAIEPFYYVFQGERLLEHWTRTDTVERDPWNQ